VRPPSSRGHDRDIFVKAKKDSARIFRDAGADSKFLNYSSRNEETTIETRLNETSQRLNDTSRRFIDRNEKNYDPRLYMATDAVSTKIHLGNALGVNLTNTHLDTTSNHDSESFYSSEEDSEKNDYLTPDQVDLFNLNENSKLNQKNKVLTHLKRMKLLQSKQKHNKNSDSRILKA
jgi:hypothetical protein